MKNNVLGFIVYFVTTVLLSEKVGVLLLAIKENGDRCHYYNGKWNKTDLAGCVPFRTSCSRRKRTFLN